MRYVKESLLVIPPILKPPKKPTPPLPPNGLDGYTANTAVFPRGITTGRAGCLNATFISGMIPADRAFLCQKFF